MTAIQYVWLISGYLYMALIVFSQLCAAEEEDSSVLLVVLGIFWPHTLLFFALNKAVKFLINIKD